MSDMDLPGSGRTTRQLIGAAQRAEKGKRVVFITHTHHLRRYCIDILRNFISKERCVYRRDRVEYPGGGEIWFRTVYETEVRGQAQSPDELCDATAVGFRPCTVILDHYVREMFEDGRLPKKPGESGPARFFGNNGLSEKQRELIESLAAPVNLSPTQDPLPDRWLRVYCAALQSPMWSELAQGMNIHGTCKAVADEALKAMPPDFQVLDTTQPQGTLLDCSTELDDASLAVLLCKRLNEALEVDREAIEALVKLRVPCSDALAEHPSIQIDAGLDGSGRLFGVVGLLAGLCGSALPGGWPRVVAELEQEDDGTVRIVQFKANCPPAG